MTALTASRKCGYIANGGTRSRVAKVSADAVIYKGGVVCRGADTYAVAGANTAGLVVLGISEENVDATGESDGDLEVKYITHASVPFANSAGADAVSQAHVGLPVWLADDQTVRGTRGNGVLAGICESIDSAGRVWVLVAPEVGTVVEPVTLTYDHVQVTGDTTVKLYKVPAGKRFVLIGVDYINPTGLAEDAANYFNIKITNAATVMANWSTLTGAQGTIAADTFVALVNSATAADLVAAAAAVLALFLDETGAATLPAGRVVIRGLLLPA